MWYLCTVVVNSLCVMEPYASVRSSHRTARFPLFSLASLMSVLQYALGPDTPGILPFCSAISRSVAVRRHISWHLAAWGIPLPCNIQLLAVQRARTQVERKKLSRSALQRQNLAKMRFSPAEKCYSHFKQPCQRLCNY
ncbi:uncharacterized protein si:ch211-260e23.9 isoform X2 [Siniperca chuatsi]|uniref:uncharacterized protein si:ch211-260e23.9 isoform X2 n=1 Tax=Siniperca chuatsi TaxID=119488 RepID=UPI001CE05F99|nr:uncharacterized protein si:ch211-260e23.9 isoform X2 [Siniperca chuatsi]